MSLEPLFLGLRSLELLRRSLSFGGLGSSLCARREVGGGGESEVRLARRCSPSASLLTSWFLRGLGELSALDRLLGLGELSWRSLRVFSSSLEPWWPLDLPEGLSLPGLLERSSPGRSSSRPRLLSFLSPGLRVLPSTGLRDLDPFFSFFTSGLRDLLSWRLLGGLSFSLRRTSLLLGDREALRSPFCLLDRSGLWLLCRVPLSFEDVSLLLSLGLLERSSLLLFRGLLARSFLRSLEPLSSTSGLSLRPLRCRGLLERCSLLFSFVSLGLTSLLSLGLLSLFPLAFLSLLSLGLASLFLPR